MGIYDKQHPFLAKIKERKLLNQEGSTKKTYHIVLDLSGANLRYKVGDAFAVFPTNPSDLVGELLDRLQLSGAEQFTDPRRQQKTFLYDFLSHRVDLMRTPHKLVKLVGQQAAQKELPPNHGTDLATFFTRCNSQNIPLHELVRCFAPLLPRFYSIASSQAVVGEEGHLLVATFSYEQEGKKRRGIGSQFLCEDAVIGKTPIPLYLQPSRDFTLPANPMTPILMIGPGTGVAPYRGFLQQRYHERAPGKNWLIFGERHRSFDYYYRSFFETLEKEQFLRTSTAFSRDQATKFYVQHCLFQHAAEVWQWLEKEKAQVYICGDKNSMAKAVMAAFLSIIQKEGRLSELGAKTYFKQLRKEKRFLLDVY
ncbi:MAG: sulfite reductase [Chlamydiota bacterium]